ncbi:hypothetical protein GCM10025771_34910 [Niveibacterium umoris]
MRYFEAETVQKTDGCDAAASASLYGVGNEPMTVGEVGRREKKTIINPTRPQEGIHSPECDDRKGGQGGPHRETIKQIERCCGAQACADA